MSEQDPDAPLDADEIEAGSVVTVGVSSVVLSGDDDPEALGHTLMLDLDDVSALTAMQTLGRVADDLGGVTALLESSPGSWHLWNLGVRDLDTQVLRALRSPCEALHVQQSHKRGRFILRAAPKFRVDSEGRPQAHYKAAPTVERVRVDPADLPQSRPHLDVLSELSTEPLADRLDLDPVAGLLIGSQVVRSDYLTLDDDTKRRW